MLAPIVDISEHMEEVYSLVRQVSPDRRDVLRFPQFLHLICLLVTGNVLGLNDAADKVLKREVRTQEFLKRVTTSDGSKRGRRRRSALVALQASTNVSAARGSMLMSPTSSGGRQSSIATFDDMRGSMMTPT